MDLACGGVPSVGQLAKVSNRRIRLLPESTTPTAGVLPVRKNTPSGLDMTVLSNRAWYTVRSVGKTNVAGKTSMIWGLADMPVVKGGMKTITRLKVVVKSVTNKLPLGSKARASGRKNWLVMYLAVALLVLSWVCRDTKSFWPSSRSAVRPPPPLATSPALNRRTRRLPASDIQRFPWLSKAIEDWRTALPFVRKMPWALGVPWPV